MTMMMFLFAVLNGKPYMIDHGGRCKPLRRGFQILAAGCREKRGYKTYLRKPMA
jgi:hypothetical protein